MRTCLTFILGSYFEDRPSQHDTQGSKYPDNNYPTPHILLGIANINTHPYSMYPRYTKYRLLATEQSSGHCCSGRLIVCSRRIAAVDTTPERLIFPTPGKFVLGAKLFST